MATVAAIAWSAYAPILGAFFRDDDFWWLATAQKWVEGSQSLVHAPAGVAPLYSLYYVSLYKAFGLLPEPYFLTLLVCHVVVTCLVLWLVWLLTGRFLAGFVGGLIFAVLYCHQEAVTWPAGGPHVFACLAIVLALICWTLYSLGRVWNLPLSLAFALTATFTKDSGIAVVPLLLVLDLSFFPRRNRWSLLWLALPVVALGVWRMLVPPLEEPATIGGPMFGPGPHMIWNLIHNVPQMLVPDLRFENYARFTERLLPPAAVPVAQAVANGLILLLSALALWAVLRGSRLVRTGALWCYAGYLPFAPFAYDFARAPRYLYIPSIGLALLAGAAALAVMDRARPRWQVVALVLLLGYLLGSFGFARLVCRNRLQDSAQARTVLACLHTKLPDPAPGTKIVLTGLPSHLDDLQLAPPLYYRRPLRVSTDASQAGPDSYVLQFDQSGDLLGFRPPLIPASGRTAR